MDSEERLKMVKELTDNFIKEEGLESNVWTKKLLHQLAKKISSLDFRKQ